MAPQLLHLDAWVRNTPENIPNNAALGGKFVASHSQKARIPLRATHAGMCPKRRRILGNSLAIPARGLALLKYQPNGMKSSAFARCIGKNAMPFARRKF